MIRAHFGLASNPFALEGAQLLPHQAEIFETLRVHCQQGGLCLVVGEPGTGKSMIKHALVHHDPKRLITPVVNRTLHTYHSVLRILCQAFQIDLAGSYVVNGIFASTKNDLVGRIDEKVALARWSRLRSPAARTPKRTRAPDLQSETL